MKSVVQIHTLVLGTNGGMGDECKQACFKMKRVVQGRNVLYSHITFFLDSMLSYHVIKGS